MYQPMNPAPDHIYDALAALHEATDRLSSLLGSHRAAPSTTTVELFNPAVLDDLVEQLDERPAVEAIVRSYLEHLPLRLAAVRSAVRSADPSALAVSASTLRTTSLMVGAVAMAVWCQDPTTSPPMAETDEQLSAWCTAR